MFKILMSYLNVREWFCHVTMPVSFYLYKMMARGSREFNYVAYASALCNVCLALLLYFTYTSPDVNWWKIWLAITLLLGMPGLFFIVNTVIAKVVFSIIEHIKEIIELNNYSKTGVFDHTKISFYEVRDYDHYLNGTSSSPHIVYKKYFRKNVLHRVGGYAIDQRGTENAFYLFGKHYETIDEYCQALIELGISKETVLHFRLTQK